MRVEVRNYDDGSIEVIVLRDDGEPICSTEVHPVGRNAAAEEFRVEHGVRSQPGGATADGLRHFSGRTTRAYVPTATATATKSTSGQQKPISR